MITKIPIFLWIAVIGIGIYILLSRLGGILKGKGGLGGLRERIMEQDRMYDKMRHIRYRKYEGGDR